MLHTYFSIWNKSLNFLKFSSLHLHKGGINTSHKRLERLKNVTGRGAGLGRCCRLSYPMQYQHPILEYQFESWLLCFLYISLLAHAARQKMAQVLGPYHSHKNPYGGLGSWLWFFVYWEHLWSEPVDTKSLSLCLSSKITCTEKYSKYFMFSVSSNYSYSGLCTCPRRTAFLRIFWFVVRFSTWRFINLKIKGL